MSLLHALLEGRQDMPTRVVLPTELIVRGSTRPPATVAGPGDDVVVLGLPRGG